MLSELSDFLRINRRPELDLKLAVGENGKPGYRAKLLAKSLERAGRSDVRVGIGLDVNPKKSARQADWIMITISSHVRARFSKTMCRRSLAR